MGFNSSGIPTPEIQKHICTFGGNGKGWYRELNIVKWGDQEPKFDLRAWNEDHKSCTKGFTFSEEEAVKIAQALTDHFHN